MPGCGKVIESLYEGQMTVNMVSHVRWHCQKYANNKAKKKVKLEDKDVVRIWKREILKGKS